jgi:hypothetical protein
MNTKLSVIDHGIDGLLFECFTEEALEWYCPLKPYTLLEYQWVRDNIYLDNNTVVIDAGCHHGNYSVVFKPAFVIAVDKNPKYIEYAEKNMTLNNMKFTTICKELGNIGMLYVPVSVHVYKVDIEGDEFKLFPHEIDNFPSVKTWIVEIHPSKGNPETIANYFRERNFALLKVDRDTMQVREYIENEKWNGHSTLIARKL